MMIHVQFTCPVDGYGTVIRLHDEDWARYQRGGVNAQNVWPNLTPEERETIITGMCRSCQVEIFVEDARW